MCLCTAYSGSMMILQVLPCSALLAAASMVSLLHSLCSSPLHCSSSGCLAGRALMMEKGVNLVLTATQQADSVQSTGSHRLQPTAHSLRCMSEA